MGVYTPMKKASEIISSLLESYPMGEGNIHHAFYSSWTGVVGLDISSHSKVDDISGGVAFIEVDHPGWIQVISLRKEEILHKIGEKYPELGIKDLRLYTGRSRLQNGGQGG